MAWRTQIADMLNLLAAGDRPAADRLSERIEQVMSGCFAVVADHPQANPFTNANKILDHVMAFGRESLDHAPPSLRGGRPLPQAFIESAYRLLVDHDLLPEQGYMQPQTR